MKHTQKQTTFTTCYEADFKRELSIQDALMNASISGQIASDRRIEARFVKQECGHIELPIIIGRKPILTVVESERCNCKR